MDNSSLVGGQKMKREPIYAKEGYIFQHKERTDEFASILWLGEGVTLADYQEITEAEYEKLQEIVE